MRFKQVFAGEYPVPRLVMYFICLFGMFPCDENCSFRDLYTKTQNSVPRVFYEVHVNNTVQTIGRAQNTYYHICVNSHICVTFVICVRFGGYRSIITHITLITLIRPKGASRSLSRRCGW